jgi:hypothetical protein
MMEYFSAIKEWSTGTHYNKDESPKHAKWKRWDIRGHILYDSIYTKCLESVNPETEHKMVVFSC